MELSFEVERLDNYAEQLRESLEDMMQDYSTQFASLTGTVEENNKELDFLRKQLGEAQKDYFSLRIQNEVLEAEVEQLKANRELQIGLNEERRLK